MFLWVVPGAELRCTKLFRESICARVWGYQAAHRCSCRSRKRNKYVFFLLHCCSSDSLRVKHCSESVVLSFDTSREIHSALLLSWLSASVSGLSAWLHLTSFHASGCFSSFSDSALGTQCCFWEILFNGNDCLLHLRWHGRAFKERRPSRFPVQICR